MENSIDLVIFWLFMWLFRASSLSHDLYFELKKAVEQHDMKEELQNRGLDTVVVEL